MSDSSIYDFVIVGSGCGGLVCAQILAMEGHRVLVLEKNHQLGGNLQVFSRDKSIFDTGVHYIGSLDKGENLYQFFKYLGILDKLKMQRMDEDAFDLIRFADGSEYKLGQGYEMFIRNLVSYFPEEEKAIHAFCDKMREICFNFPLYNLNAELKADYFSDQEFREINAYDFIASLTTNKRLQNVLAGNNPLYAGVKAKTPFYVHALILNSYILGSYKLIDGGSQIANVLSKSIRALGGEVLKRKHVVSANYDEQGHITEVVTDQGETFKGKHFISNMHPIATMEVFGENRFLSVYKKRVRALENTISSFTLHLTFKPDSFPYLNYNIYQYDVDDVWAGIEYTKEHWPEGYFVCTPKSSKSDVYADSMSVMTYMSIEETAKWKDSFNTTAVPGDRGSDYEAFKKEKEEVVLRSLEKLYPDIRSKIVNTYSSTPLTYRDFIGNHDGSLYGILKDCNEPMRTFINPKTKIPNLYLTGQNIIFHGILGVTIGAFVTSFLFVDREKIMHKVKNA